MVPALSPIEGTLHPYALERAVFYDLEIYPNLFTATFWDGKKKTVLEVSERKNQLFGLYKFLESKPLLVGFNNGEYDNTILHYLLQRRAKLATKKASEITSSLFSLSQVVIKFKDQPKEMQEAIRYIKKLEFFPSLDMLEVIREGYTVKGLKAVGINLKWPRIQDLPYHWSQAVAKEQIEEVLDYNYNDVAITEAVFKEVTPRLQMRQGFSEKYSLHCYSDADSRIAKTTLNKFYAEYSQQPISSFERLRTNRNKLAIKDLVFPWVTFQTPELNDYLKELRTLTITEISDAAKCDIPPLTFNGVTYTLALGGIHSVDTPGVFLADSETLLWDMDVASQYPRCILNNAVCPAHLNPEHFLGTLDFMVTERLTLKKLGKTDSSAKVGEAGLKIAINTAYGLFNSKSYWLYDPKCTYQVTINNQLSLLMLVESLNLAGIEVLSANTDGLIIKCAPSQKDVVNNIKQKWQQATGFELEDTFYTKYIRRDINNYITLKEDGEAKVKGIFIPQGGILKGYDKPIIAIALRNYFLEDIPISDTVTRIGTPYIFSNLFTKGEQRVTDIYDYCMAQKVGHTFDRAECSYPDGRTEEVQRSLRYYASNQGVELFKVKKKEDGTMQRNTLLASSPVTLFNDYTDGPYDINFQYYIEECQKIICQIEGREFVDQEKLLSKLAKLCERVDKQYALNEKYQQKYCETPADRLPKIYHSTRESLAGIQEEILIILNQLRSC